MHAILAENARTRSANTRAQTPALLKGLIFGPTGAAMSPTHTRKGNRLYRYYVSQDVLKRGPDACPVGRVPAAEIEAAVIDQLRGIFRQPEIIVGTWRAARAEQDDITEDEAREALLQLDPLWDELFPAEQARIVQLLVERVDVGIDGVSLRLRADGLAGLVREVAGSVPAGRGMTSARTTTAEDLLAFAAGRRFHTVLADPPWRFQNRTGKVAPEHRRLCRYETMALDEIMALPVAELVDEPAHLYLWVPNALLAEGLAVMAAWGFPTRRRSSGTRCARTAARTGAASASTSATSPSACCSGCAAGTPARSRRGGGRPT